MEDIVYIPLSQETFMTINSLKKENEPIQDFIKRLIEDYIIKRDIELIQREKMIELWDNEEDKIWEKIY